MPHPPNLRATAVRLLTAVACAALPAGCTDKPSEASSTTTVSTTSGSGPSGSAANDLALGQRALVTWQPGKASSSRIGLRVTKVEQGKIGDLDQFPLNTAAKSSSVYYVSVGVTNTGKGDLGGARLTLYGEVSDKLVVPPVILNSPFQRCSNPVLPKKFGKGAATRVCLVMLAPDHGRITQIQWRDDPDTPVSWRVR